MTENEAIEWLRKIQNPMISEAELYCAETCYGLGKMVYPEPEDYVFETAIQALEEIQQYRAIGTVKKVSRLKELYDKAKWLLDDERKKRRNFESIGTVEEFKALKEKNEPKKPIRRPNHNMTWEEVICPRCSRSVSEYRNQYCDCGQKIDWKRKE